MLKALVLSAAFWALLALPTPADAATVHFQLSPLHEPGFAGGEFTANLSSGATLRSFCLQRTESISMGSTLPYSYTIDTDGARSGSITGGNPDPVSSAAASIFVAWLSGDIEQTSANSMAVQNAIWAIEGELSQAQINDIGGTALALYTDAIANFSTTDNAALDNPLFSNIRVLNPYRIIDGQLYTYQSQLILIPLVPLPGAAGLALAGFGLMSSRRRR